ncbi:MAG: hypothetical protein COB95_02630, partial [Nitrosopumilales archaeon]
MNQLEVDASRPADDFDLFDEGFDRDTARESLEKQKAACILSYSQAEYFQSKVTPAVKVFRYVERQFSAASLFATAQQQLFLVILLFLAAAVTTQ